MPEFLFSFDQLFCLRFEKRTQGNNFQICTLCGQSLQIYYKMTQVFYLVILSAVVPLPPANESVTYYLLQNGSDTINCGGSVDSACLTFEHVLNLYYAKPPTKGLIVVLDQSLLIDNETMVSF